MFPRVSTAIDLSSFRRTSVIFGENATPGELPPHTFILIILFCRFNLHKKTSQWKHLAKSYPKTYFECRVGGREEGGGGVLFERYYEINEQLEIGDVMHSTPQRCGY